jgi:acyl carrier protein
MSEPHDTIVKVVRDVAGANAPLVIDLNQSLFDAGVLDSFGLPELVSALEKTFAITIPDGDLASHTFESINKIASYIDSRH